MCTGASKLFGCCCCCGLYSVCGGGTCDGIALVAGTGRRANGFDPPRVIVFRGPRGTACLRVAIRGEVRMRAKARCVGAFAQGDNILVGFADLLRFCFAVGKGFFNHK